MFFFTVSTYHQYVPCFPSYKYNHCWKLSQGELTLNYFSFKYLGKYQFFYGQLDQKKFDKKNYKKYKNYQNTNRSQTGLKTHVFFT